jgi:hypothetical protein
VILEYNGVPIRSKFDITDLVRRTERGQSAVVTLRHQNAEMTVEAQSGLAGSGKGVPMSRRGLITGYIIAAVLLLGAEACEFPAELLVDMRSPEPSLRIIPTAGLFSLLICLGLLLGSARRRATRTIARVVFAYANAGLVLVFLGGWWEFTDRLRLYPSDQPFGKAAEEFFDKHPVEGAFGLGFWAAITLPAFVILIISAGLLRMNVIRPGNLAERLSIWTMLASAASGVFILGCMIAEYRFPTGEVGAAQLVWPIVPVVSLGSLTAWVLLKCWRSSQRLERRVSVTNDYLDKVTASAAQISVAIVILLYLGISQTAGYVDRSIQLIGAREAFANDLINEYVKPDAVWKSSIGPNGKLLKKSISISDGPWAEVEIAQFTLDSGLITHGVEVRELLSQERWTARPFAVTTLLENSTHQVADSLGIHYEDSETPIKIYPRIEAQLRATEVAFPGVGLSLQLGTFILLAPIIVFGAVALFARRARIALQYGVPIKEPWALIDEDAGAARVLGWLWLAAITLGPWVLAALVVEALDLTLKSRGTPETSTLDWLATAYIGAVVAMLVLPTKSILGSILALRALAAETSVLTNEQS